MSSNIIDKCRICENTELTTVIELGNQVITSRFPLLGDTSTPIIPISLCMCAQCGLLQLLQTTNSSEMYEHEYGYRSGISNTMKTHLKSYQEEICKKVSLSSGDIILDIGSNDSTMLQYYNADLVRVGIDPTGKQFKEYYGDVKLIADYFTKKTFQDSFQDKKCKVVSSISMFYDLPDPVQFAKDIFDILDDNGIWTCEQSYLPSMLKTNSIDTICHEHLEYYSLHQIQDIANRAGFKIVDVLFNDCNGGSFRVYFSKNSSSQFIENTALVNNILEDERLMEITQPETFKKFIVSVDTQVAKLKDFIKTINSSGKQVWIYGASTKGNCLLQYAKIDSSEIRYAVERNLSKVGKMTATGIEIISEETMRNNPPAALLVLPWHFRNEIVEREKIFLENGGKLVFPFPVFEVV
jgi:hypothetical protein